MPRRRLRDRDPGCGRGRGRWRPVGLDLSADQLRLARTRLAATGRADAGRLPVRSGAAGAAVLAFADTEDLTGVAAEVARVLRPGGRLVYVGLHPCFLGPFVNRTREADDRALTFVAGYGDEAWARAGSGGGTGLWARVGGHHKTLAAVLGAVAGAGLAIRTVREFAGGGVILPRHLGLVADRP